MIVHCPSCGQGFDITDSPKDYQFSCHHCGAEIHHDLALYQNTDDQPDLVSTSEDIELSPQSNDCKSKIEESDSFDDSTRKLRPPDPSSAPKQSLPERDQNPEAQKVNPETNIAATEEYNPDETTSSDLFPQKNSSLEEPLVNAKEPEINESLALAQAFAEMEVPNPKEGTESTVRMRSPLLTQQDEEETLPPTPPSEQQEGNQENAQETGHIDDTADVKDPKQEEYFDPDLHIENEENHTLATAPTSQELESSASESTAVSFNPLLMQQIQSSHKDESSFIEDESDASESTAIVSNPLLQHPAQHPIQQPPTSSWGDSIGAPQQHYHSMGEHQTSYSYPPPSNAIAHTQTPPPPSFSPHVPPQPQRQKQAQPIEIKDNYSQKSTNKTSIKPASALMDESEDLALTSPPDRRGTVGSFLLLFLVLGPLSVLLGWLSLRKAKKTESFTGRGVAYLAIIGGSIETILLASFFGLFTLVPANHPFFESVRNIVQSVINKDGIQDSAKLPPQPARLTREYAIKLIQKRKNIPESEQQKGSRFSQLYIYQEPHKQYAYAHWRDQQTQQNIRTLFLYSNRKHWHIAALETSKSYEVRASLKGTEQLTPNIAQKLIVSFWRVRGKFTGTRITHLYVVQKTNAHYAYAYWKLTKQRQGEAIKQWKIKSLFHRSNKGKWYISLYAIRIDSEEIFRHSATGSNRLTKSIAQKLLSEYHNDNQKPYAPRHLYIHQEPHELSARAYWQNGRIRLKSLFRYSNQGRWFLALPNKTSKSLLTYKERTTRKLPAGIAKKLLSHYLRNHGRKLLSSVFASGGQKGKPPQRLPKLNQVVVFQPENKRTAWVRWKASFPKKVLFYESLFYRSQSGFWHLSKPFTTEKFDLRFHRKGGSILSAKMAQEMLLQLWREDEQSEKFNGARIKAIYTFQKPNSSIAWAHWRKKQSGLSTRMRTHFYLSNQGIWFLGNYDMGLGYGVRFSHKGKEQLTVFLATHLLKQALQKKQRNKEHLLSKQFSILIPYVYQEGTTPIAYLRWIQSKKGKNVERNSLFHRANNGKWFLSIISTPQLIPAELQ